MAIPLFGQDSLGYYQNQRKTAASLQAEIDAIVWLTEYYFPRNEDSTGLYLTELGKKTPFGTNKRANYYHGKALYLGNLGELEQSLVYFDSSLVLYSQLEDQPNIISVRNNKSGALFDLSRYNDAYQLLFKNYTFYSNKNPDSLKFREAIDYISCINHLAKFYAYIGDDNKALGLNEQSMNLAYKFGDSVRYMVCKSNWASTLVSSGDTLKGIAVFKEVIPFKRRNNFTYHYGIEEYRLGSLYNAMGLKDSSEYYFKEVIKAIEVYHSNVVPKEIIKLELGIIEIENGNLKQGFERCFNGYKYAVKSKMLTQEKQACNCLSNYYELKGDFKNALVYRNKEKELIAKLNADNIGNEIFKSEEKIKFENRVYEDSLILVAANNERDVIIAKQEACLFKKNVTAFVLASLAIVLIVLAYLIYKNYKRSDARKKEIAKSLGEKEILLKEIHHRVKNNFQVISSLLNLQSYTLESDEELKPLRDAQNRIQSMALVHQKLYGSDNLARVDMKLYFESLIDALSSSYAKAQDHFILNLETNGIELSLEKSVPLGLIMNEIITNAFKYGASEDGNIYFDLELTKRDDGKISLVAMDKGPGFSNNLDLGNLESLGLELVQILSEQIEGELKIENDNGTSFTIIFTA